MKSLFGYFSPAFTVSSMKPKLHVKTTSHFSSWMSRSMNRAASPSGTLST